MNIEKRTFDGVEFFGYFSAMPQWRYHRPGLSLIGNFDHQKLCRRIMYYAQRNFGLIDLGANWGAFSVLAANRTDKPIYAFEPHPTNFEVLAENLGSYPNVTCHRVAICESNGTGAFVETPGNHGGHHLTDSTETESIAVPMATLDSFEISAEMIKLDVEGVGYEVIKGGMETFAKAHIVFWEPHPKRDSDGKETHENFVPSILGDLGFIFGGETLFYKGIDSPLEREKADV